MDPRPLLELPQLFHGVVNVVFKIEFDPFECKIRFQFYHELFGEGKHRLSLRRFNHASEVPNPQWAPVGHTRLRLAKLKNLLNSVLLLFKNKGMLTFSKMS